MAVVGDCNGGDEVEVVRCVLNVDMGGIGIEGIPDVFGDGGHVVGGESGGIDAGVVDEDLLFHEAGVWGKEYEYTNIVSIKGANILGCGPMLYRIGDCWGTAFMVSNW